MGGGKGKKTLNQNEHLIFKNKLKYETASLKQNQQSLLQNQETPMQNKPSPMQNQQSCTEITLDGVQRGIKRNRTL